MHESACGHEFFCSRHFLRDFLYHTYVGTSSGHLIDKWWSVRPDRKFVEVGLAPSLARQDLKTQDKTRSCLVTPVLQDRQDLVCMSKTACTRRGRCAVCKTRKWRKYSEILPTVNRLATISLRKYFKSTSLFLEVLTSSHFKVTSKSLQQHTLLWPSKRQRQRERESKNGESNDENLIAAMSLLNN